MTRRRPQDVTNVLAVPRPCSKCKTPTIFATKRGRAVHPCCEPEDYQTPLDPAAVRRTMADLVTALRPVRITDNPPVVHRKHYGQDNPYVAPPAPFPCAACGETDDIVRWLPHDVWRCFKHTPMTFPVQPWEGRGWPTYNGGDRP